MALLYLMGGKVYITHFFGIYALTKKVNRALLLALWMAYRRLIDSFEEFTVGLLSYETGKLHFGHRLKSD